MNSKLIQRNSTRTFLRPFCFETAERLESKFRGLAVLNVYTIKLVALPCEDVARARLPRSVAKKIILVALGGPWNAIEPPWVLRILVYFDFFSSRCEPRKCRGAVCIIISLRGPSSYLEASLQTWLDYLAKRRVKNMCKYRWGRRHFNDVEDRMSDKLRSRAGQFVYIAFNYSSEKPLHWQTRRSFRRISNEPRGSQQLYICLPIKWKVRRGTAGR